MLSDLCQQVTSSDRGLLPADHKLGPRLVCPEYSKSVQEVKTYPLLEQDRIFALCWNIDSAQNLYATMQPAPSPFCYQLPFSSGEKTQLHTHDYIELTYVVEGEFRQRILGKDIIFSKGDLCLIDKNCLHQDYLLDQPAIILFLGIANDMFAEIMDENVTTQKIISFLQSALLKQKDVQQYLHFRPGADATEALEDCLYLLLRELCSNTIGSRYICKGLLLRIFRLLSTTYEFSLSREQRKTMNWIIFEEVSEYIQQHSADITIQQLVDTFHFQEDYFNRLIKAKTGMTYSAYMQKIRLEKAEHLLTTSPKSVEEIADIVGYHNKGYFYKIFQKRYGMTPSQYRKKG
ncbi:MAG: AraC family transcriptional regulator [Lachnospiraceae bacterium]